MEKEKYYIHERTYKPREKKEKIQEKWLFWENIIGKDFLEELYNHITEAAAYLENQDCLSIDTNSSIKKAYYIEEDTLDIVQDFIKTTNEDFIYFYEVFMINGCEQFRKKVQYNMIISVEIYKDFLRSLLSEMESVSIRVLIQELHSQNIQAIDDADIYTAFVNDCLKNEAYRKQLFLKFPILERCLWECVSRKVAFFEEVLMRAQKDKKEIEERFFHGQKFEVITGIDRGIADAHFSGKQVLKLNFDNGKIVVYKPHSVENEKWFGEFLIFLGNSCGVDMYMPEIVECEGYGWIEYIEQQECKNTEEIKNYHYRVGISLLAAYLLGTNDIHCENIIAMGEYPIIVDLENMAGAQKRQGTDCEELINRKLRESVLTTGILPYLYWNRDGKGIDLSALMGGENCEVPFKMPVIQNPGTAKMCIEYKYATIKERRNRVKHDGKVISPNIYEKEIVCGFERAYQYVLEEKEIIKCKLDTLKKIKCRHLLSDTQKYSMLLNSSYHPIVMEDAADREFLLYSLWRGRDFHSNKERGIVEAEIVDLLNNDIPYFYFCMGSSSLYDSRNCEIQDYFEMSPIDQMRRKLNTMDIADMKRQELLIHLSLSPSGEEMLEDSKFHNLRKMVEKPDYFSKSNLLVMAENIADKLLEEAVFDEHKEKMSWLCVNIGGSKCGEINIHPCGMYLYNGIAGNMLFLKLLSVYSDKKKYAVAAEVLEQQLFTYTDQLEKNNMAENAKRSGIYNGEGSVVYLYLMLYWLSEEEIYMRYAEKHAEILKKVVKTDMNCDLLDGKAGAILVFCFMYQTVCKQDYLNMAVQIAESLINMAVDENTGIGWKQPDGDVPLLGMAHGNSGIMVAFSKLYKLKKDRQHYECLKKALAYEDNHFNTATGDWKDFRDGNDKMESNRITPAAWCHGAGGILLSRLMLNEIDLAQEEKMRVKVDIERAHKFVAEHGMRKELCICHGECGNRLIARRYEKSSGKVCKIKNVKKCTDLVLAKEWFNPGLMDGYVGIGYYLVMQIDDNQNFMLFEKN